MGDRREDRPEGARASRRQHAERFAEGLHQPADLGPATPRKDKEIDRTLIETRALSGLRPQLVEALDQRVTDIGAGWSSEAPVRLWLERFEGEHVIHIGAHLAGAARAPCPDARADVIDDRQRRQLAPDAPRDRMGELGTVDDDDRIRPARDDGVDRAIDPPHDRGQARHHGADAHDGDIT
jgi:hypothetical protein